MRRFLPPSLTKPSKPPGFEEVKHWKTSTKIAFCAEKKGTVEGVMETMGLQKMMVPIAEDVCISLCGAFLDFLRLMRNFTQHEKKQGRTLLGGGSIFLIFTPNWGNDPI